MWQHYLAMLISLVWQRYLAHHSRWCSMVCKGSDFANKFWKGLFLNKKLKWLKNKKSFLGKASVGFFYFPGSNKSMFGELKILRICWLVASFLEYESWVFQLLGLVYFLELHFIRIRVTIWTVWGWWRFCEKLRISVTICLGEVEILWEAVSARSSSKQALRLCWVLCVGN